MYYLYCENKGADQLHGYHETDLHLFSHMQNVGFLMTQLKCVEGFETDKITNSPFRFSCLVHVGPMTLCINEVNKIDVMNNDTGNTKTQRTTALSLTKSTTFLAHRSCYAYRMPMLRRPSVVLPSTIFQDLLL